MDWLITTSMNWLRAGVVRNLISGALVVAKNPCRKLPETASQFLPEYPGISAGRTLLRRSNYQVLAQCSTLKGLLQHSLGTMANTQIHGRGDGE